MTQQEFTKQHKYWSEEDNNYLLKYYGKTSLESLSKKLNRSIKAIQNHMYELEGTASAQEYTGYLNSVNIAEMTGLTRCAILNALKKNEMPTVRNGKGTYLVSEENFWKWMKVNTSRIKPKKIPDYVLMISPDWYKEVVADMIRKENNGENKSRPLTNFEKTTAWNLYLKGDTIKEISEELNREYGAIQMCLYRKKVKLLKKKEVC